MRTFRPPAVPLVACDPYSIWLERTDTDIGRRTGRENVRHRLHRDATCRLRRLPPHGRFTEIGARDGAVWRQRAADGRSTFSGANIDATLTFHPAIPGNIALLSRPTTYVTCSTMSSTLPNTTSRFISTRRKRAHTNLDPDRNRCQKSRIVRQRRRRLKRSQNILGKSDDIRIDWVFYLAAGNDQSVLRLRAGLQARAFVEAAPMRSPAGASAPCRSLCGRRRHR
jgi:hypothetical protein